MNLSHCHTAVKFCVPSYCLGYTHDRLSFSFTPRVHLIIIFIRVRSCVVTFLLHWLLWYLIILIVAGYQPSAHKLFHHNLARLHYLFYYRDRVIILFMLEGTVVKCLKYLTLTAACLTMLNIAVFICVNYVYCLLVSVVYQLMI